ncbi:GNAT family N-acetyltransferase [Lysinibacillus sp. SGAir0095]|uniref:lipid II:glycine glycyltransferase FemX n=1 Tax=Lysinibacillus sp. SGAir0095 TaxID=2070463 RepID=UPI0010CCDBD6|nr:GNAT family N-acetyltransferase [Lysinibacillus sp. SGAir0095]QCR31973.1 GNAT family N-acetyltransferase [Lysinibacillus sp. SGAir0095]
MLSILTIDEKERWNEIVKSFQNYDVYYLASYVKAFELHGDGQPLLVFYEDQTIRAINVVMKRDLSKDKRFMGKIPTNTFFDFATPYGFGGFLIDGEIKEEAVQRLEQEYRSFCQKEGIVTEVVRFHPVTKNSEALHTIYEIATLGKTITVEMESMDQIQENLVKSNKYKIKKSLKAGVEVSWGWDKELIEEFIALYNETMKGNNATDYYYFNQAFYMNVLQELTDQAMIVSAEYEKQKIAMAIILISNQQLHYHLSALNRDFSELRPMNILLYEVACWGLNNGYKTFHLGGGLGSREDNLYAFKRSFNKNSNSVFKIGKKIFSERDYEMLLQIRREEPDFVLNENYFPAYRS